MNAKLAIPDSPDTEPKDKPTSNSNQNQTNLAQELSKKGKKKAPNIKLEPKEG